MEDLSWARELSSSVIIGLIMLAGLKWVLPKLIDTASGHLKETHATYCDTMRQTHLTFTGTVDKLLADNREARQHCDKEVMAWRDEFKMQRAYDEQQSNVVWAKVDANAERMAELIKTLEEMVSRCGGPK